jgi:hypothetical protein
MATQEQAPLRVVEVTAPDFPMSQTGPINASDASTDRDERPGRDGTLMERLLYNLRVALSVWHT